MNRFLLRLILLALAPLSLYWLLRRRRPTLTDPQTLIQHHEAATIERHPDGSRSLTLHTPAAEIHLEALPFPQAFPDHAEPHLRARATQSLTLTELDPSIRYHFRLILDPTTPDRQTYTLVERVLPFDNLPNFRDIGGYPTRDGHHTRWNRVYRSAALLDLSPEDRARLSALNLNFICDLRSADELERHPDTLPDNHPLYQHLPMREVQENRDALRALLFNRQRLPELLIEAYQQVMIDRNAATFGALLKRLADPANHPALIHCMVGKDRTGVATALLLAALKVPDEIIIADYTLSNRVYPFIVTTTAPLVKPLSVLGIRPDDLQPLLLAPPEAMRATLAYIRQHYTSVENYLFTRAGLTPEELTRLRQHLLE